ncbi:MAG TPA: hypothetical protein VEC36_02330 [Patescibacteria group bacterium]|nr:hypothetical protein [Patescibacteria group bacterium]
MQNPDKLRSIAMPFLMLGLALMTFGMNTKSKLSLWAGIAGVGGGIALLKASVWERPKESRRWKKEEEGDASATPHE